MLRSIFIQRGRSLAEKCFVFSSYFIGYEHTTARVAWQAERGVGVAGLATARGFSNESRLQACEAVGAKRQARILANPATSPANAIPASASAGRFRPDWQSTPTDGHQSRNRPHRPENPTKRTSYPLTSDQGMSGERLPATAGERAGRLRPCR